MRQEAAKRCVKVSCNVSWWSLLGEEGDAFSFDCSVYIFPSFQVARDCWWSRLGRINLLKNTRCHWKIFLSRRKERGSKVEKGKKKQWCICAEKGRNPWIWCWQEPFCLHSTLRSVKIHAGIPNRNPGAAGLMHFATALGWYKLWCFWV